MDKNSNLAFNNKESVPDVLSKLLRTVAQQLIRQAVESELSDYLSQHQHLTADGRIAVVRNCYLPKREILTGIGPVSVHIPKIRSRDGVTLTFRSALVPPYVRKTRSLEVSPYHGCAWKESVPVRKVYFSLFFLALLEQPS